MRFLSLHQLSKLEHKYTQLLLVDHAGTGDLGVLTTHETSPWFYLGDAGSTRPG